MRVLFDGSKLRLTDIHTGPDSLSALQTGGGPIPTYFEGMPWQRGYGGGISLDRVHHGAGMGSVLRRVWKYLRPLATSLQPVAFSAAKSIGKEGLETGARILNEVARGGDIGEAIGTHGEAGLRRLVGKAQTKLQKSQLGEGKKGRRKKRRGVKKPRMQKPRSKFGGRSRRNLTALNWQIGGRRRGRKRAHPGGEVTILPTDVIGKTVSQKALLKRRRLDTLGY